MQKLFEQQKETIREMETQYRTLYATAVGHGIGYLEEALASLEEFVKQTSEMMTNAKIAQDAVSTFFAFYSQTMHLPRKCL
jgi:hypothetical protein